MSFSYDLTDHVIRYDIDQLIQYFDRSIISLIIYEDETIGYKNDIALKLKAHEIHSVNFLQEVRTSKLDQIFDGSNSTNRFLLDIDPIRMDPKNLVYQLRNWWKLVSTNKSRLVLTNRVLRNDWERKSIFDLASTSGIMMHCDLVVKLHDKNIEVIKNRFDW